MIIPIRCFSCGKPIAHLWTEFKEQTQKGDSPKKVMTDLGLDRFCCRSMFMTHVDLIDIVSKFRKF